MTHVSQKKIKKEVATELADQFITFLATARTKKDARVLARELLSQTERVMLAKRLAIVVLLVRGYSFTQIQDVLGVTRQTIVRIWTRVKHGEYAKIVRYARRHTRHFKKESGLDVFMRILHTFAPPRSGHRRWKTLESLSD